MAPSMEPNVTKPDRAQRTMVKWLINDPDGGFNEHTLYSASGPSQYVSISKKDRENNEDLKRINADVVYTATIDRQGTMAVSGVPYVNIQAQIGVGSKRKTYSHVNVVADKMVTLDTIREALNLSLKDSEGRWIVEETSGDFRIQTERPVEEESQAKKEKSGKSGKGSKKK